MAFDEERPVDEFVRDSESAGGELATGGENTLEESAVDDQGSGFIEKDSLEQGTGESEGPKEDAPVVPPAGAGEDFAPGDTGDSQSPMGFLEIIYGVIAEPKVTFRYLGSARPLLQAVALMIIVTLFDVVTGAGELRELPQAMNISADLSGLLVPLAVLALIFAVIGWFVNAATIGLFSQLLGGAGNGIGLLSAYAFASLPMLLTSILGFGINVLGLGGFLAGLANVAGVIWTFVLQIWAVREIEGLSLGRSILAYFAFPLAILVLVIILVVFAVVALGPFIGQLSNFR